jgi:hypothetical protein
MYVIYLSSVPIPRIRIGLVVAREKYIIYIAAGAGQTIAPVL